MYIIIIKITIPIRVQTIEVLSFSGVLLLVGGIVLIAVSSHLPSGDYFLIVPFCVAAGVILLIRGCINKLAKRQQRREEVSHQYHRAEASQKNCKLQTRLILVLLLVRWFLPFFLLIFTN